MSGYVNIVRHFREAAEEIMHPRVRRAMRSFKAHKGLTWDKLLAGADTTPIVLVSPSKTGKTTELTQRAGRLRAADRHAVYAEAAAIVDGIETGLGADEIEAYRRWSLTTHALTLFIDAIDELYLRNHTVADLVRRLELELTLSARPVRLVLSARNGAWNDEVARPLMAMLERNLYPKPRLVTFEPLDSTAVRLLASDTLVSDVDAFMAAFEDDELDTLLELRPCDVALLVSQWNSKQRFGHWSNVVAELVDASLSEDDVFRGRRRQLALREGWSGVMRVAAACTLMRTPNISVPAVAGGDGAVSARRLFEDWPLSKLVELFECPLFMHKGVAAEAVQLPQGAVSHFLTGRWVAERVQRGWAGEEVRDALLVQVFDETSYRIPPAMRAAVGWIAAINPAFRRLIRSEYPEIVLFEGDPDGLSDEDIRIALGAFCERRPARSAEAYPSRVCLRKLARPGIENEVLRLLQLHATEEAVQSCLLALVEHGRYRSCVPLALDLARSRSQNGFVRAAAVAAVAGAGGPEQRGALVALAGDGDENVRSALLRAVVPELLNGTDVVSFLAAGGDFYFRHEMRTRVAKELSDGEVDATLRALLPALTLGVVSVDTGGKAGVAVALVLECLARHTHIPQHAIEILAGVEHLGDAVDVQVSDEDRAALDDRLREHEVARRALWCERFAKVEHSSYGFEHVIGPKFGDAQASDIPWLWTLARDNQDAILVLRRVWQTLSPDAREGVQETASPDLVTFLTEEAAREAAGARQQVERDARAKEKRAQEKRQNEEEIAKRRDAIESGNDLSALIWAWQRLVGTGAGDKDMDPVRLLPLVGQEFVEVFRRGFIACWRKQDVDSPAPGASSTPTRYLAGLTGLALEVRAGLAIESLSKGEAVLAAQYALYQHGLPFWFGDLLKAHSDPVVEVLYSALKAEWEFAGNHHGLLSVAAHVGRPVAAVLRRIVLELLQKRSPAGSDALHWVVDLLLTETSERSLLGELARQGVAQTTVPNELAQWTRLWAHVDPLTSAEWLLSAVEAGVVDDVSFVRIAELLEHDLEPDAGRRVYSAFTAPRALALWIQLLLKVVRVEDDPQDMGLRLIGPRDRARFLRQRCLSALAANPTQEARAVLLGLVSEPTMVGHQGLLEDLAERQCRAAATAMARQWSERDIVAVEHGDEKPPRSLHELSQLVRRHLHHVHRLVANDDFSYRALFSKATNEREIQLWVASSLRERARGLYDIVRENVVDDDKEVDISAFAPGIGSVPIEIKPLGPYSFEALKEVMENQLLGQYMLPADREFGVLLLVRRELRRWRINAVMQDLEALVAALRDHASAVGRSSGKTIHIECVDLLAFPPVVVRSANLVAAPPPVSPEPRIKRRSKVSSAGRGTRGQKR